LPAIIAKRVTTKGTAKTVTAAPVHEEESGRDRVERELSHDGADHQRAPAFRARYTESSTRPMKKKRRK